MTEAEQTALDFSFSPFVLILSPQGGADDDMIVTHGEAVDFRNVYVANCTLQLGKDPKPQPQKKTFWSESITRP